MKSKTFFLVDGLSCKDRYVYTRKPYNKKFNKHHSNVVKCSPFPSYFVDVLPALFLKTTLAITIFGGLYHLQAMYVYFCFWLFEEYITIVQGKGTFIYVNVSIFPR